MINPLSRPVVMCKFLTEQGPYSLYIVPFYGILNPLILRPNLHVLSSVPYSDISIFRVSELKDFVKAALTVDYN